MNEKEWMEHCVKLQDKKPIFEGEFLTRQAQGKVGLALPRAPGNIPVLYANGTSLAEAWENSLIALWARGVFIRTQYDGHDDQGYTNPPSKDCTMIMAIGQPLSEPMIHKDFPGGIPDLEEYRQEVVDGIKDKWIRDQNNPADKRWEYTYHGRMFNYAAPGLEKAINQIEEMARDLAHSPITRRAQTITWKPWEDIKIGDPACLQSVWGRILREHPEADFKFYSDEKTGRPKLNLNWRFRSRDAYKAAFMNDYALIHLGHGLAKRVSELMGEEVTLARVVDMSDSYHIYGSYFKEFLERFGNSLEKRQFLPRKEGNDGNDITARTMYYNSPLVQEMLAEARATIPAKIAVQDANYAQGKELTKDSTQLFKA